MKYRDHVGSLHESMKTVREVNNVEELITYLNEFFHQFHETVEEIKFDHIGMDERIGWDTYLVSYRLKGKTTFAVAGQSDGKLN